MRVPAHTGRDPTVFGADDGTVVAVLKGMSEADWLRNIVHPELGKVRLDSLLGLYDWHSRHHTAHITSLREAKGW